MESRKVQAILGQMQKSLECSICLEMMSNPVSTNCGHQFCRFCLMEFLERKKQVPCPLCKKIITKRSLTEREQLGSIVGSIRQLISAFQMDTGEMFSPPRGSQANILPSSPEPSQSSKECTVQAETARSGSRKQLKSTGAETCNRSTLRKIPGKPKSRRGSRGKSAESAAACDLGSHTEELLKCIAEGVHHGAMNNARTVSGEEGLPGAVEMEESDNGDSAIGIEIEAENNDSVSRALLEMIENGSHGALHSNENDNDDDDVNNTTDTNQTKINSTNNKETNASMESDNDNNDGDDAHNATDTNKSKTTSSNIEKADTGINKDRTTDRNVELINRTENNNETNEHSIGDDEPILLSGASDKKERELQSSGNSGSGQYSLFRTPLDPKQAKAGKKKNAETVPARPRRPRRSRDALHEDDNKDQDEEKSELLAKGDSVTESPDFLKERNLQQTYGGRRTKPNLGKQKPSKTKVSEWLKNIPVADKVEHGDISESSEKVQGKKGRKKSGKVALEEGVMGQRIKHLAEKVQQTHKDLLFNVDDFANSPRHGTSLVQDTSVTDVKRNRDVADHISKEKKFKETEANSPKPTGLSVVQDTNVTDVKRNKNVYEHSLKENKSKETKDDEVVIVGADDVQLDLSIDNFNNSTVDEAMDITDSKQDQSVNSMQLTTEDQTVDNTESEKFIKPVHRKRIFKTRTERTGDIQNTPTQNLSSTKDDQTVDISNNKCQNQEKPVDNMPADPFEFVSSQNTPVKVVKGKKKGKSKATKSKKNPLAVSKYNGKFHDSLKNGKEVTQSEQRTDSYDDHIVITASQKEINKAAANLNQAESYDLLTCTQDAVKEFANEEKRSEANPNRKKVSFREPVISDFVHKGKIDVIGYRKAKTAREKEKDEIDTNITEKEDSTSGVDKGIAEPTCNGKDTIDVIGYRKAKTVKEKENELNKNVTEKKDNTSCVSVRTAKSTSAGKDTVVKGNTKAADPERSASSSRTKQRDESDDDASEDWRFHDNSSGTDDLDIEPEEKEYEQPDLEIQPEEVKARLSQVMFEQNILMKSQETDRRKSPDPSVIGETPLIFTVPKFQDKSDSKRKNKRKKRVEDNSIENQAVVPETPVLTFGSIEEMSNTLKEGTEVEELDEMNEQDVDKNGKEMEDSESLFASIPTKAGESSEETQAPSLDVIEVDGDEYTDEKMETGQKGSVDAAIMISESAEPSMPLSCDLTNSCSQNSESILLAKPNDQQKQQKVDIENDEEQSDGADTQTVRGKKRKGQKRKRVGKSVTGKSKKGGSEKFAAAVSDESRSDVSQTNSSAVVLDDNDETDNVKIVEATKHMEDYNLKDNSALKENEIDMSEISVESAVYNKKGLSAKKKSVKNVDLQESQQETNSVTIVPDSAVDEEVLQLSKTTDKTISANKGDSQTSSTKKRKVRSLTRRNSSNESIRQRNLSGILISPPTSVIESPAKKFSLSPENIFAEDSEMPVLESSPFDATLEPVYLSDDEIVVAESKPNVAIVTVYHDNSLVDNHKAEGSTRRQRSATPSPSNKRAPTPSPSNKRTPTPSPSNKRTPTPSPSNKRTPSTPRGLSKRQRLSKEGLSDSHLSSWKSPAQKLPPTPKTTPQQYKSPLTKYTSPRMMVTHKLPLVGQSRNLKCDSPTAKVVCHSRLTTPSKLSMISPVTSLKYSPSVSKHKAIESDNSNAKLKAKIVDVNIEDTDGESISSSPIDLPDLDKPLNSEIPSSADSVASVISSKKNSQNIQREIDASHVDSRCSDGDIHDKASQEMMLEQESLGSMTCSAIPDSLQCMAADETKIKSEDIEEMPCVDVETEAVNAEDTETGTETKASSDLNLDSSDEDEPANNNRDFEGDKSEEEESLSSPEFTLLDSSDEEDARNQAMKEINKFNEIKQHTEHIVKANKATAANKTKKNKHGANKENVHTDEGENVGANDEHIVDTVEDDGVYCTRLDSSPVQPEVILESDVEDDRSDVPREMSDDSEDEVVRRKHVKKNVIESSSDEDDENSRPMNLTSSSAFSSISENLNTQERLSMEHDLERMEREMRAMKEQLRQSKKMSTPGKECTTVLPIPVDDDSDCAMIEADDTGDEMEHDDYFVSPPPVSPCRSLEFGERGDNSETEYPPPVSPSRSLEVTEMGDNTETDNKEDNSNIDNKGDNSETNNKGDNCKVSQGGDNLAAPKELTESQMETLPPSLPEVPDSMPGQRSALKDLDNNVIATKNLAVEKKSLSFIASGLSSTQMQETKKLAAVNDAKFYNRFNETITHVIVKPDPVDDTLCDRTLKFFQGVANNCWVVNHFWVVDSKQVGHLLPEGAYEIQGDTANGTAHQGPKRSRLAKDKLFRDMEFALIGNNEYLSKDSMQQLIELCGGRVVDAETLVPRSEEVFVVACTDMEDEESEEASQTLVECKNIYKRYKLLTFSREWILDSITMYRLQPLHDYVILKAKNAKIPTLRC